MKVTRNTKASIKQYLINLGVCNGITIMVHSSLSKIGWTEGGANTVIRALLEVIGPDGTLVMPTASPHLSDQQANQPPTVVFDPKITPTSLGVIPETFRTYPNALRSSHPLVSVTAVGPNAAEITKDHSLPFSEGVGTPFEKLYQMDAAILLLGVGFERCTSLHYAEYFSKARRVTESRLPMAKGAKHYWVNVPDMGVDNGTLFPVIGAESANNAAVRTGKIGNADCFLFSTRALVDFAKPRFDKLLAG